MVFWAQSLQHAVRVPEGTALFLGLYLFIPEVGRMDDDTNATGEYGEASTPRLQERIAQTTQDQDKQLDAIYTGVVRLKGAAVATNEEVQAQNQMLDEIAVQIDNTQQSVQEQTAVAKKVASKHRGLAFYYIIILLEIVGLIVVLVI